MKVEKEIDYLPRDIQRISYRNDKWEIYHYTRDDHGDKNDKWHIRSLDDKRTDFMTIDDLRSFIGFMKEVDVI